MPASSAGTYVPVTPARTLDTRSHTGASAPAARGTVTWAVTGHGGIPASGVSAVVFNLSVLSPPAGGYVTAWADGVTRPTASSISYSAHKSETVLAVAPVGSDGRIALYNGSAATQQIVGDVAGYYVSGQATTPGAFTSVGPARTLDTRTSVGAREPTARQTVTWQATGAGGVPSSGVSAVVVNLSVLSPASGGYVTAFADGTTRPTASSISYSAHKTENVLVEVPVSAAGRVALYNGSATAQQLVGDVAGYYLAGTPTAPGTFVPLAPNRALDTRTSTGAAPPAAKKTVTWAATGHGGVPSDRRVRRRVQPVRALPGLERVRRGLPRPHPAPDRVEHQLHRAQEREQPGRRAGRVERAHRVLQRLDDHPAARRRRRGLLPRRRAADLVRAHLGHAVPGRHERGVLRLDHVLHGGRRRRGRADLRRQLMDRAGEDRHRRPARRRVVSDGDLLRRGRRQQPRTDVERRVVVGAVADRRRHLRGRGVVRVEQLLRRRRRRRPRPDLRRLGVERAAHGRHRERAGRRVVRQHHLLRGHRRLGVDLLRVRRHDVVEAEGHTRPRVPPVVRVDRVLPGHRRPVRRDVRRRVVVAPRPTPPATCRRCPARPTGRARP